MHMAVRASNKMPVVGEMTGAASMRANRAAVAMRRVRSAEAGRAERTARTVPATRMRRFTWLAVADAAQEAGGLGDQHHDQDGEEDDVALREEVDAAELVHQPER